MSRFCDVYVIATKDGDEFVAPIKVGISRDSARRLPSIQTGSAKPIEILHWFPCPGRETAREIEQQFHQFHSDLRLQGEWFDMTPALAVRTVALLICHWVKVNMPDLPQAEFDDFMKSSGLARVIVKADKMLKDEK